MTRYRVWQEVFVEADSAADACRTAHDLWDARDTQEGHNALARHGSALYVEPQIPAVAVSVVPPESPEQP